MLLTFIKELKYFHDKQCYTFLAGVQYPKQEVIDIIGKNNFDFCINDGYFQETQTIENAPQDQILENEPQEIQEPQDIQETKYRFEKNKKPFKKDEIVGEQAIIDAGLDIETLKAEEIITWLK